MLDVFVLLAQVVNQESEPSVAYNLLLLEIFYLLFAADTPGDLFARGGPSDTRNPSHRVFARGRQTVVFLLFVHDFCVCCR